MGRTQSSRVISDNIPKVLPIEGELSVGLRGSPNLTYYESIIIDR